MLIFDVVSFSEFSGKLQSLTVFIFTADYGKTCRGRGHVSQRVQLVIVNMPVINVWYLARKVSCENKSTTTPSTTTPLFTSFYIVLTAILRTVYSICNYLAIVNAFVVHNLHNLFS